MQSIRTYATQATATTSKVVPRSRPLPQRKQTLLAAHQELLTSNPLVLFLRPGDFTASEWRDLRAGIAALPQPPAAAGDGAEATPPTTTTTTTRLTNLRPGLLPALLRQTSLFSSSSLDTSLLSTTSHLKGPLAVLTSSTLHPPTLASLLTLLHQFSISPSRNAPPIDPKAKSKPEVIERLPVLSALFDGAAGDIARVKTVAQLPELEVLRAQIVGLLSAPGARITGVLSARGQQLGRTLEGFKLGLQEKESGGGEKAV